MRPRRRASRTGPSRPAARCRARAPASCRTSATRPSRPSGSPPRAAARGTCSPSRSRPLSRNSRRFPWVPTATISSARFSWASRNATSSLVPAACTTLRTARRAVSRRVAPRRATVGVRVQRRARSACRRRGRFEPAAALGPRRCPCRRGSGRGRSPRRAARRRRRPRPTSTGRMSRMYGAQRREVLPVVVAADDDEDRPARELVVELGQARPAEQQVALLCMYSRVLRAKLSNRSPSASLGGLHVAQDRVVALADPDGRRAGRRRRCRSPVQPQRRRPRGPSS